MIPVPGATKPFTVLLVCTGNICRSPLAERLGRAFLDERLGSDASLVRLRSAGTRAVAGSAMHPDSALVLEGFGAVAGDFRARQLVASMVTEADLTLTMTRTHRREVLTLAPGALQRVFILREAADLVELVTQDGPPAGETLPDRARALVREMAVARSRRLDDDDDVRDPVGQPREVHQSVGEAIVAALLPLLGRIAELRRAEDA